MKIHRLRRFTAQRSLPPSVNGCSTSRVTTLRSAEREGARSRARATAMVAATTLSTAARGCGVAWRRSKWRTSSVAYGGFVFVLFVVVVLRGRAMSFTGGERSRRGDVTSSRARTSPRTLVNPHTPGRTFAHHPALSDFPIAEVPFDADYVTEFTD